MKLSIKSISLKVLALVLAVCAGVAVYSFANTNGVVKADEPVASFALKEGASIRDAKDEETGETYFGLGFETTVNTQWLTENSASSYSFGTLIFPTVLNDRENTFSTDKSVATNASENFAVNFRAEDYANATQGFTYRATIVFDREYITELIKVVYGRENPTEDEIDIVLENLYAMEMTAVSYVQYKDAEGNNVLVYTNAYATSMLKVAIRLVSDPVWGEKAKEYIKGEVTFGDAYVSAEDNVLVVDGYEGFDASKYETVIVGNTNLISGAGYSFVNDALVLNASVVSANVGSYAELYFVDDESGDVVVLNVLYVNKALKTAQEVEEAFDYGDQKIGDQFKRNDNSYVLANDIDMTGVVMSNRMIPVGSTYNTYVDDGNGGYMLDNVTSVASDVGFAGIFDGRGYAISNVTVSMVNWSLGQHIVDETGKKSWINAQAQGFFANVRPEGVIKNVAFINVYGDGTINQNFGINGLLGTGMNGTLENVYLEANVDTLSARGPFANYSNNAVVKNVVVNFPKPAGYTIESGLELAAKPAGGYYDIYAYGYGAMSGATSPLNRNTKYENVIVVSPMPINLYKTAGSGYAGINNVTYAENETDLRVLFDYAEGTTVAEALEAEKTAATKHTYQVKGIRRYDDLFAAAADTNYVQKLVDTGYFKVAEGQVLWHNQRAHVTVNEPVDYDAAEGKFLTTSLRDKEITGITVDGVKLVPNVDYTIVDGEINFINVPEKNNQISDSQATVFEFETKDIVYVYDNVTYWTSIIDNATELREALDISYEVITGIKGTTNYGFFKLSQDIDMEGVKFDYTGYTSTVKNQNYETGFAGIFDGYGYAIKNANPGRYGLFGNFTIGGSNYPKKATVVRNLAVTNFTCESSSAANSYGSVFGRYAHCNDKTILFENIYVSYADNSPVNGLIAFANRVTMNNVLVDTNGNTVAPGNVLAGEEYGSAVAGKAIAWNNNEYNDGGALFPNTRFFTPTGVTTANINNVVTFGKVPVIYQWAYGTNYNNFWVYDAETGWAKRNSGTLNPYTPSETYYGFAGNQEYGDIPIMTGMKAGFATLVNANMDKITIATNKSPSNTFPGYVCTTCGETFSLSAGTCSKCSVALSYFANLWTTPWSFTWELLDVQAHENTIENGVYKNGTYVLAGVSKYNTASEMAAAYTANNNVFASFLGDAGNGMWKVSSTGVLMWHDDAVNHDCVFSEPTCTQPATCEFCGTQEGEPLGHNFVGDWATNNDGTHFKVCSRDASHILTENCSYDLEIKSQETLKEVGGLAKHPVYYKTCECGHVSDTETIEDKDAPIVIDTPMDYEAATGQLFTTILNGVGVDSAELDGNALTLSRDNDKNIYLFKDAPVYNNNLNYQTVTLRVVSGEYTYDFTNVTYWTMIINDGAELKAALDIDYTVAPHNYGFYKLGNDIKIDKNNPITFDYVGYSNVIKNRFSAGGFAGVFDGAGHTLDFNGTWLGSAARGKGLFGNLNTGGGVADATMSNITIKDLAIVNISVGGAPSTLILGQYGKTHSGSYPVVIENLYVNSFGDVPGGLFNDMGVHVKLNNVFIDLDGQNTNTGYASAVLSQILRTTDANLENNITNFVTLGNSLKTNLAGTKGRAPAAANYYKTIKSTANGDGTYTHKATHGGWGTGNTYGVEYYYAYAGGNQEYGNIELVQGLKLEFAEIAKTVANSSTAVAGYYCATCGNTFSLEAGTCATCGVALTQASNLWAVEQAYVVGGTKLSEVNNADCHTGANGELVLNGAYAYYSVAEMKTAGVANAFESFTGEAGNGCWTVYGDGMLKWHSVEYKHTCTGAPATCDEASVCTICGEEISPALGHDYSDTLISFNDGNHRRVCSRDANHVLEEQCTYDRYIESPDYLVSEATIGQNAIYKVSCACGHGSQTETFEAATADLTFDYVVDYDAFTGTLMSTALSEVEITKVLVGNIELTVANGGLSFDEEKKLHVLTPNDKDGSLTNAVPYMNNLKSTTNVFTVTVYSANAIYRFTNVEYSTMIIYSSSLLKMALDYDYSATDLNNLGFYKLGNNIDIDKATWTNIDYSDIAKTIKNDAGSSLSQWNAVACGAGFAGIFDGAGYTINFNKTIPGTYGLFGAFGMSAQLGIKQPATVKNVALTNLGGTNWKPVIAQFGATHTYNKGALLENIYVTWDTDAIMAGLIYEINGKGTVINNVVVDIEDNRQYGAVAAGYADKAVYGNDISDETLSVSGYYGGTLTYSLRRGNSGIEQNVTNFISLGRGGLGKTYTSGNNLRNYFKTTGSGTNYTHVLKNGGWAAAVTGGSALSPEAYYTYAGNQEYGDQPIPTGMKAGFAEIAKNYANATAIPGYYCAVCGETFSLEEGTCCETELTKAADLWKEPIAFTWKSTKLSEVVNANVSTTGEVVFYGASKYNTTQEMKDAYADDETIFDSFTGETGNGLWTVVDGKLTWVGSKVSHVHTFKDATCTEAKVCLMCGHVEGEPLGHDGMGTNCDRCGTHIRDYALLFAVENGEATLSGFEGVANELELPSTYNGYAVTAIGDNAFANCTSLTSVVIPGTVTTIGDNAFFGCTELEAVYYGNTADQWALVSIGSGNEAFVGLGCYVENQYSSVAFFGDSITQGYGDKCQLTDNNYVNELTEMMDLDVSINNGLSSTTFCVSSLSGSVYDRFKYSSKFEQDGEAVEVVLIMAGVNDFNRATETHYGLGTFLCDDNRTIYGSARTWCEKILEYKSMAKYANTRFIICTPTITSWNDSMGSRGDFSPTVTNLQGITLRQMCEAMIETCEYYGVEVFDMNIESGIYWNSAEDNTVDIYFGDGIHPGDAGHYQIATVLYNHLRYTYVEA